MDWTPHVTVAAVVPREDRFLIVEERDESGERVYNQPAGHLEERESLVEAVIRETHEETGWKIEPVAVLGIHLYRSPRNQTTYLRTTFLAEPAHPAAPGPVDESIIRALWLSREELEAQRSAWRSDLVGVAIEQFDSGRRYPLELLQSLDTV